MRRARDLFSRPKTEEETFYHLCFCLSVPQAKWVDANKAVGNLREQSFFSSSIVEKDLFEILRRVRFYQNKSSYLLLAKESWRFTYSLLQTSSGVVCRRALIDKVKGMGPKVASHLLRNLGDMDVAILDTHSLRFLKAPKPRSLAEYEAVEEEYRNLALNKYGLKVGELDLLVWQQGSQTPWKDINY